MPFVVNHLYINVSQKSYLVMDIRFFYLCSFRFDQISDTNIFIYYNLSYEVNGTIIFVDFIKALDSLDCPFCFAPSVFSNVSVE